MSRLRLFHKGNYKYVKSLNLMFILCVLISKCMPYRNLRSAQHRNFKYHLNVFHLFDINNSAALQQHQIRDEYCKLL